MRTIRLADQRGHFDPGWIDTWHTFSFTDYYDPAHMGFGPLRVINDDRIAGQTGFGMHGHKDMEIITYLVEGQIEHRDSLGHGAILKAGDIQVMHAGRGIRHSECNPGSEWTRLLQIWVEPTERGLEPGYTDRRLPAEARNDRLFLIAGPENRGDNLIIHAKARLYAARLSPGFRVEHQIPTGHQTWIQMVEGTLKIGAEHLARGDGLAIHNESNLELIAGPQGAEVLAFDLG